MFQKRKKYYSELMSKAQSALKLYESKASGLTADDVKNVLGELHAMLIDMEIANETMLRAQHELEHSYNKYANLFDSSPIGLLTLNAEGSIMEANLTFANITGMERRKLIRLHLSSLIYTQDRKNFRAFFDVLRASVGRVDCEIRILKENLICRAYVTGVKLYSSQDTSENYLLTVSVM